MRNNRAFTLIEMLIYISILTGVMAILVLALLMLSRSYGQFREERSLTRGSIVTLERITREARQATSINTLASTFAASSSVLVLNSFTASGTPLTIEFSVSNGRMFVKENGVSAGALTSERVEVTNFAVYRLTTGRSEGVKVDLGMRSGTTTRSVTREVSATAVLRGSY